MRSERWQQQGDGPRGSPQSKEKSTAKPLPKHQAGTKGVSEAPGSNEGNVDSRWREKKVPPSTGDTTASCQHLGSAEKVQDKPNEKTLPRGCPLPQTHCPQPTLGHGQPLQTFSPQGPHGTALGNNPRRCPWPPRSTLTGVFLLGWGCLNSRGSMMSPG